MTESGWSDRAYDLLLDRLHRVEGDPVEECERVFRQAFQIRNVRVAAAAAVICAEIIRAGQLLGLDVASPDELSDEALASIVRDRLLPDTAIVTIEEAAALMECTPQHVRRLARQGRISGRRTPDGSWRCTARSVTSYKRRGS